MKMRLTRMVSFVMAVACCFSVSAIGVSAAEVPVQVVDEYVVPRWNNGAEAITGFTITSSGRAYVSCDVHGIEGLTTSITIEIQLQRKTLLWWSDVDDGYWFDSFSDTYGSISDSIQLTKTGKYRAIFTVTVSGTGGADDVIEDTLTYEYE